MKNKIAAIATRVAVSLLVSLAAIMAANFLYKDMLGHTYGSPSLPIIFLLGSIIPIWMTGTIVRRIVAIISAVIAGIIVWAIPDLMSIDDPVTFSNFVGVFRSGAMIVSEIVAVAIMRR